MTHPKNRVKTATIGLFVLATLYPFGLAVLGINLKASETPVYNNGAAKGSVYKSRPAMSKAIDRNSLRYRLLLK